MGPWVPRPSFSSCCLFLFLDLAFPPALLFGGWLWSLLPRHRWGLVLSPGIWIDKLKSFETNSFELGRNCSSLFLIVSLTDSRRDRGHGATTYKAITPSVSVAISAEMFPVSIAY
ncbi:hypothetical protein M440DRAFT_259693 [Trichoderma longibrachiatum ATCC 18648]|uniref:Uncharacterized protein n=1 Tax=Trichoderma longibrachiatum ATCC 18648 TaxID=983965 RepID=A0A2T4CA28_TRILO|nr:hypothetical protein M440DRAFT_259693 [Trichoderma longibrachiatum ATCC 18648]